MLKRLFFSKNIFYIILIAGVFSRLFLVVGLPIWHDEFYSIWAANHSFWEIVTSRTDLVHPPGYYLLLHFWGIVSQHLYWYRFLSVLTFIANIFLVKKLAERLGKKSQSNILVFLYVFSGYFLTFDWQVRMYTPIVTLILSSLLILNNIINNKKGSLSLWIYFTLINFLGLYIDYAYVWYFAPVAIFTLVYCLFKNRDYLFYAFDSFVLSGFLFVISYPTIFLGGLSGIHGIEWMKPFLRPNFYIPFFLGSHTSVVFSLLFLALFIYGLYKFIYQKKYDFLSLAIIFSAFFSLIVTLIYSYYKTPLFHIRSLQIVGIMVIMVYYFGISALTKVFKPFLFAIFVMFYIFNFIIVNQTFFRSPGSLLIDYFPWRDVLNSTDLAGVKTVKYKIVYKLPTQMLLGGLEYTLKGNENIGRGKIKMEEYDALENNINCTKFYDGLMELYKCK